MNNHIHINRVNPLFTALILFILTFSGKALHAGRPVSSPGDAPFTFQSGHFIESTRIMEAWKWHLNSAFRWIYPATIEQRTSQFTLDGAIGVGLPGNFELNIGVPFKVSIVDSDMHGQSGAGPGDVRTSLLYTPVTLSNGGFGLLLGASLYLPTGQNEKLLGEGSFSFKGLVALEWNLLGAGFKFNIGYVMRPSHAIKYDDGSIFEQDDDLLWEAGIRIPGEMDLAWSIEAKGSIALSVDGGGWPDVEHRPVWIGGGFDFPSGDKRRIGFSAALLAGGRGPGVMFGISTVLQISGNDEDGDGVKGRRDKCPLMREDKDGFMDDDGCPDLDNDKDGFPDKEDKCPDKSGGEFSDDGC